MNKRIKTLAKVLGYDEISQGIFKMMGFDMEKFAKLIVQECSVYCEGHILPKGMAEENDLNYNDGVMDCAIGLKQH